MENSVKCRVGCAACCIYISISSPIPGMPNGKSAGIRCVQLDENSRCKLYGSKERPEVCSSFQPSEEMCGQSTEEAYAYLKKLEEDTAV